MTAVAVHHVVTGPPDAPVVVLSNSLGSTHAMWDAQADALAEHFRVVRYDTRGHGGSPVPAGPYDIDDLADDVVALLDTLGVEKAHFVGLSLGGMTGMRLAARNPERVDRLVVLCTGAHLTPSSAWTDRAAHRPRQRLRVRRGGRGRPLVHARLPRGQPRCQGELRGHRRGHAGRGLRLVLRGDRGDGPAAGPRLDCRPHAGDRRRRRPGHAAAAPRGDRRQRPGRPTPRRTRSAHLANAQQPATITPAIIAHLTGASA